MRAGRTAALIVSLLMVFGVLVSGAGAASALTYPSHATLTVNDPNPKCGQTVDVVGTGYLPNTLVTVSVGGSVVGTVMTDDQGSFTFPYTLPVPCVDGEQIIRATDGTTDLTVTVTVSSTTETTVTPGNLPRTGSSGTTMHLVQIGILLVAGGGILLLATRKRRQSSPA
jgi:LPXTG-motif cell wall-anchored protein